MSAGYDGNIKLGVSVTADSKSVVAELGALRKQIVDMFSSVDKSLAGGSGSFSNLEKSLSKIATDVGNIAKVFNGMPADKVAKVAGAVKEVGTAASDSGKAVSSAFDFDVETASTEELYQKLKQLRAEAEAIKKQKLAEGFTPVQAENSKDVRVLNNQMNSIANELRNTRGVSDVSDYMPAVNFHGDMGDAQVKNLQNALAQAYETLHELQSGLATMSETDDGFDEKTARVNELTQAIANLNEQLGLEQAKFSGAGQSDEPEAPRTAKVSPQNMGYNVAGTQYIEIYASQGKQAAEAFMQQYNELLSTQGKEAADNFAKSFNTPGDSGDSMIAQYKRELADLQTKMKDFDKFKITMSDDEVGKTLLRIEELKKRIAELTRDAKDMNLDVPMDDGLRDNLRAVEELQTKMKQFQKDGTGFSSLEEAQGASARIASLTQSINEYFKSLDPAQQKLNEFKQALTTMQTVKARAGSVKSMTPEERTQYEAASAKVKQYRSDLASLIQIRNALSANIKQFEKTGSGMSAEEYKQAKVLLEQVSQQYSMLAGNAEKAGTAMSKVSQVAGILSKVSTTVTGLVGGVGKLISSFKKLGKSGTSSTNAIAKGVKKAATNVAKIAFGVRGLFALFRRLRTIALDSLKAIASQFPEINAQFSETKTLIAGLKGSFGTMIQPLATAVLPVLNQIISALTTALQLLGKFFAALSGQGVIYKATAKTQDFAEGLEGAGGAAKDAVKSLMGFDELNTLQDDSGGGGGGSDVTYEEETIDPESAIAKFADMLKNAWQTGDFFDVGQFLGEKLRDGLNKVDDWIKTEGTALSKKLGNSFATLINGFVAVPGLADSIGRTVADAINMGMEGLHQFLTTTNWLDVGKFVADTIMSFFDNINWELLGQTVGSYIMAFVDSIYGFITNIDFERIGQHVASSINNIFDVMGEVDETGLNGWQKIGKSISDSITGLLEMIIKFVKEVDWAQVGTAIGEMIASIDFGAIIWDVTVLIANLVAAIAEGIANWAATEPISAALATMLGVAMLGTKIAPTITTVIGFFGKLGEVFQIVSAGAGTLSEAIQCVFGPGSILAGVGMVIGGAITAISSFFSMLKNGFSWLKEILMVIGIAIAAVGAIILGAPAAVAGVIAAIVAAVMTLVVVVKDNWEAICNWFKETWNAVCEWFKSTWETIKTGWNSFWTAVGEFFKNLWNGICQWFKDAWNNTVNWFKTTWTNIQTGWNNFWNKVHQIVQNIWNGIVSFFTTIWTTITNMFKVKMDFISGIITSVFNGIKTTITNVWTAIKDFITATLDNIKDTFSGIWNGIKSVVTGIVGAIKSAITGDINGLKSNISNALNGIKSIFTSVWNGIKTSVTNIVNGMSNVINGVINGIKNAVNGVASTVKNTINTVIRALNGLSFTVPSWVPGGMGGKRFGFNIPYLAQGAVIPPNKEFMAVLGDQKHGTNIEAPLDTIKQAVAEELSDYIDAMMAGFDAVVNAIDAKDMNVSIGDSAIGRAAERYQRRQQLVRGNT